MSRLAVVFIAAVGLARGQSARAQAPPVPPASQKFEVASLKPSQPGGHGGGIRPAPGGECYLATNIPLKLLITVAYRIKFNQITGGPSWVDTDLYDMNAKAERPSSIEELHTMLQDLLADRFKLRFHREFKELPIYALLVDKDGTKLKAHDAQSAGDPWIDQVVEQVTQVKLHAKFSPMDYFAWRLSELLDRPVVDQTGLKGGYDFDLAYTRELPPGIADGALVNGAPIETSGPTVFEAIQKQLGLRLERQKGPAETFVIDSAEKPVEN